MKRFFYSFMVSMMALTVMPSCSGDEPGPGPTTDGNDPVGTIVLEMNNETEGRALIGGALYIDANNNFHCENGYICSYGTVKGLGYVTTIPTAGWVNELKVTPECGYVYYNGSQYFRIFVVDYRYSLGNAIIGATVKYQAPFAGVDEEILLDTNVLTFSSEGTQNTPSPDGGTVDYFEIPFTNSNIVAFTPKVEPASAADWLSVSAYSTFVDYPFLNNGIRIIVKPTDSPEQTTGTIVIKTGYDKITTLSITRSGREAFISFNEDSLEDGAFIFGNNGQTRRISVSSNIPFENISFAANPTSWCHVELADEAARLVARMSRANENVINVHAYVLTISCDANDGATRETTVSLNSSTDHVSGRLIVRQDGASLEVPEEYQSIYLNREANSMSFNIKTSLSNVQVKSSANWVDVSAVGSLVRLRISENGPDGADRKATITFPGFDAKIEIDQSKYAVGDTYHEGIYSGVVSYMNGSIRYFRSEELGRVAWSTENFVTGATNEIDGYENYIAISSITNWRALYPAFALVADLNTNGQSGWVFPAAEQAFYVGQSGTIWTSTESNEEYAFTNAGERMKQLEFPVYAIHKF